MDALALLCHLSADGASTLVRLRHAGYSTLQDILLADDDELAEVLEAGPRQVTRLRRQAESLEDRIGDASEAERRPALSAPAPAPPLPRPAARPTPLLCKLETEPLSAEEGEAEPPPSSGAEPRVAERPAESAAPAPEQARKRYWMPIRREPREAPPDPGPSGPFA
jgi:hypothetical protein